MHKVNTYHNMLNRAYLYTNKDQKLFTEEFEYIKQIAVSNNYEEKLINNLYNRYIRKAELEKLTSLKIIKNNKKENYITYKFNNNMVNRITKLYKKENCTISYKPVNKIINFIKTPNLDSKEKFKQCGVYKINCDDCDKVYIGSTNRSFEIRYSEHIRAFTQKKPQNSNVAEHLIKNNHSITGLSTNFEILEICTDNLRLKWLERYYIYKFGNSNKLMNKQNRFENDQLLRLATVTVK